MVARGLMLLLSAGAVAAFRQQVPTCASVTCPTGKTRWGGAEAIKANTVETCCTDACSAFSKCPDGYAMKTGAEIDLAKTPASLSNCCKPSSSTPPPSPPSPPSSSATLSKAATLSKVGVLQPSSVKVPLEANNRVSKADASSDDGWVKICCPPPEPPPGCPWNCLAPTLPASKVVNVANAANLANAANVATAANVANAVQVGAAKATATQGR